MDRIRTILYECALIVLFGAAVTVPAIMFVNYYRKPTIEDFKREYFEAAIPERQVAVAEKYYDLYPLPTLLKAIEDRYSYTACHIQAHAIGRVVYRHDPNFADAVQKCGGSCTYGCFHGVQMEMFQTDSDTLGGVIDEETPEAYTAHILSIAKDICTKPEVQSVVRLRQCVHGLGHLFLYNANGDLKAATDQCNSLFDENGARSCRTGAFMEQIFTVTTTSPKYLMSTQPCDAYPGDEYICYRYKAYSWIYIYGSIEKALQSCDALGSRMLDCIAGVGSAAATPDLLATNAGIEKMCGSVTGSKRNACEAGAYLSIINLNGGDDSEHICDMVAPDFRNHCLQVRARYSPKIYYGSEQRPELTR